MGKTSGPGDRDWMQLSLCLRTLFHNSKRCLSCKCRTRRVGQSSNRNVAQTHARWERKDARVKRFRCTQPAASFACYAASVFSWLRLARHAFATLRRPHTTARPLIGALKSAHPRGAFCPLHFCGNGKTNRNPGLREWWFPPKKSRSNNPAQHSTKPYVLSIIPQIRGQIYTLTSFCRRINAKPVIKSSRKPGHLAIKM